MRWLCAADGPIRAGDIIYGVGVAGTAVYEYGPAVVNWVGTYGSAAWDATTNFDEQVGDKVSEGGKKAWNWVKEKFGGSGNQDPNNFKKMAEDKVTNALKNFESKRFKFGDNDFLLDKSGLKHMLQRHHPDFWDGSVKQTQTFFGKGATINDVTKAIQRILEQNRTTLIEKGTNGMYQLQGKLDGVDYVLGINNGRIGQLYFPM